MDEDTTDAAWNQAQLEEQEKWERHTRVATEFTAWAIREGLLNEPRNICHDNRI